MRANLAAVDLGATSGRVLVGGVEDGVLHTRAVARFPNEPVRLGAGLHWNLTELYRQVLAGLAVAERAAPGAIESVGVDSWAVDYGLLRGGRLLGVPFHYRDARGAAGVAAVHERITPEQLYRRTGLQHLDFTTLFQLATEGPVLAVADRLLMIPDLIGAWLTGVEVAERTNASTTGLLDPATGDWDHELAALVGADGVLAPLVDPGSVLGPLLPGPAAAVGRSLPVRAVASHDTASAVLAVPATGADFAYVSCGTWGLVGLELDAPVRTEAARAANFTNEGGVDGRTRFLRNVMGLWLLTESVRHWCPDEAARAGTLADLLRAAGREEAPPVPLDVDDPVFAAPAGVGGAAPMPERIAAWYVSRGVPVPGSPAALVRAVVDGLARAYAATVAQAAALADREVRIIHLVGGGALNELLCQALADAAGLPVCAGPVEATAAGNLLVQARALGQAPDSIEGLRAVVAASGAIREYRPR